MKRKSRVGSILQSTQGFADYIPAIFITVFLSFLVLGGITLWGEMVKLGDLQQVAQQMVREVSLRGQLDSNVDARLTELEKLHRMSMDMTVDGDFIGSSKKLRLESTFVIAMRYDSEIKIGGFRRKVTYVRKASGIVEEYHK